MMIGHAHSSAASTKDLANKQGFAYAATRLDKRGQLNEGSDLLQVAKLGRWLPIPNRKQALGRFLLEDIPKITSRRIEPVVAHMTYMQVPML
eukprot:948712-Pleurochrysis_carterae.AAC.2